MWVAWVVVGKPNHNHTIALDSSTIIVALKKTTMYNTFQIMCDPERDIVLAFESIAKCIDLGDPAGHVFLLRNQ